MTTKSTAGHTPYRVVKRANGNGLQALCVDTNTLEGGVWVNSSKRLSAAHLATAELFAAAPETAAERDRLREENASLQEALEEVIKEVSWFVARKKNLAEIVAAEILVGADGVKVWADVLDEDLDIARAALARQAKAEGRS